MFWLPPFPGKKKSKIPASWDNSFYETIMTGHWNERHEIYTVINMYTHYWRKLSYYHLIEIWNIEELGFE
jgi:hypothetical protein